MRLHHAYARQFLQQHAHLPLAKFSKENIERRVRVTWKDKYANAAMDAPVYLVQNAEDLIIAVIGGAGKHSAYIPTFGATRAVTRALKRGGEYVRTVESSALADAGLRGVYLRAGARVLQ